MCDREDEIPTEIIAIVSNGLDSFRMGKTPEAGGLYNGRDKTETVISQELAFVVVERTYRRQKSRSGLGTKQPTKFTCSTARTAGVQIMVRIIRENTNRMGRVQRPKFVARRGGTKGRRPELVRGALVRTELWP